jgi:hypothetical protein
VLLAGAAAALGAPPSSSAATERGIVRADRGRRLVVGIVAFRFIVGAWV